MTQIHRVTADRGDQCDPKREHPGKNNSNGCVLLDLGVLADRANAERGNDACPECPPEERFARAAANKVTERNARQDGMSQGISKESHAAQYDIRSNDRAYDADKDRGN